MGSEQIVIGAAESAQPVLEMKNISKTFSGIKVLKNVKLSLYPGEVHALMGENGAGKSTLMKILGGIYTPDPNGEIIYKNTTIEWKSPLEARNKGISVIHQELNLSPNLTISENILMGTKFPKKTFGIINWEKVHEKAGRILSSMGSELNPRTLVSKLSVAEQQVVEIARALSFKAEVLIMDEPTASLSDKEINNLFTIIEDLKKQGVAIVYISHRMDEIFKISNRFTVLRDGDWIASGPIEETNPEHLVKLMVGRDLKDLFKRQSGIKVSRTWKNKKPVLELKNVTDQSFVQDVSFHVYPGEIVGIAGLVGAGRTELVRAIFGAAPLKSGSILVDGRLVKIRTPIDAIRNGIAHVPESRKEQGLFLDLSVKENLIMTEMKSFSKWGMLSWRQAGDAAGKHIQNLGVKAANPELPVSSLSGGNQQKVVIAKWLSIKPKVLLLDEPTRGVDIGAKTEIHKIISGLAEEGLAVLMISSELPEVLGISDRILVMSEGRLTGELPREEATQEKIMHYATGGE